MKTSEEVAPLHPNEETRRLKRRPRGEPLRVAVLLDSFQVPLWVATLLEQLQHSEHTRIVLVVQNRLPPTASRWHRAWQRRSHLLYSLYSRIDRWMFRPKLDPFSRQNLEPLLSDVPHLQVEPRRTKFSDYFGLEALEKIREFDLDVALRFGFRILRGEALEIAKFGVWSYHHGDNQVNRGGPPGFWEVLEGNAITGSVLQILSEDLDGGQVLYRSYAATDRRSVYRNRCRYYWKSGQFVPRVLERLFLEGELPTVSNGTAQYRPYHYRLYRKPGNRELASRLLRFARRTIKEKLKDMASGKYWFLAYQFQKRPERPPSLFRFKELHPPSDRSWADPFPVRVGKEHFVFIEDVPRGPGIGRISVLHLRPGEPPGLPTPVLERPYHLSYPFVFRWQDEYFLIPETGRNRSIELYRCVEFPGRWELDTVLFDQLNAVDATLHQQDDRWWMFVNVGVEGASNHDELHIYHAPNPRGPWTPHRSNPVKSDVRSARPAGRLFRWRGQILRPAQDCSQRYGWAISLNRVTHLSTLDYAEEEVGRIEPRWREGLLATHTYNRAGNLVVIDVMAPRQRRLLPRTPRG